MERERVSTNPSIKCEAHNFSNTRAGNLKMYENMKAGGERGWWWYMYSNTH
jgi:hypothetical protein